MIASNQVAVRGNQNIAPDAHRAGGKDFAVESDIRSVAQVDVAVLAREDRVAADEHAVADSDAPIAASLRVDQAVVVDNDVVADPDLVRMTKHDVLTKDHVAATAGQKRGIQRLAEHQSERAGRVLRRQRDELVLDQRAPSRLSDDESGIFLTRRGPLIEELLLGAGNVGHMGVMRDAAQQRRCDVRSI